VAAAPSNAEGPVNVGTASSPECMPYVQSLEANQQLPGAAPYGQRAPSGNSPGPHDGNSPPHAGAAAPDLPGIPPAVDLHTAGPAPANLQPDSSRASRPPPTAAPAGDTAPMTAGPAPTKTVISADSSPGDSGGADSDVDFTGFVRSPVAPGPPIDVDNQQISLAHPYGTRL
jgi:hypothetical protein